MDTLKNQVEQNTTNSFDNGVNFQDDEFEGKSAAEVATDITADIKAALLSEIKNDPEKRGYAGKSNKEIADLLNKEYEVQIGTQRVQTGTREVPMFIGGQPVTKADGTPITQSEPIMEDQPIIETRTARLQVVLNGIPFAPNAVTETMVSEVLA